MIEKGKFVISLFPQDVCFYSIVVGHPGDMVGDSVIPEDHFALWEGQSDKNGPLIWTVPIEYCKIYEGDIDVKH